MTVAFSGGGASELLAALDRSLLDAAGADRVVIVPAAAAYERPERLVTAVTDWFAAIGARAEAVPILARHDAFDPVLVDAVRTSRFTYLGGGSSMHLRSVLKDTPVWAAMTAAVDDGGVVVGSAAGAMVLSDPMVDPRGGAFTLGLGMVKNLAVVPAADQWSHDRLHRTLELAHGFPVAAVPTGAALVLTGDGTWEAYGLVTVHRGGEELPVAALSSR